MPEPKNMLEATAEANNLASLSESKEIYMRGMEDVCGTTDQWLVGQILDAKSNVCPTTVQSTSKDCPKTGHVEGLSSHRPSTVQALSNLCQVPKHLDRDWTGKSRDCRELVH